MTNRILVNYKIAAPSGRIKKIAEDIALEQTVELPKKVIFYKEILRKVVGRIESIESNTVKISYDLSVTDLQLPQFLNMLYGNISLKKGIKVIGIELPKEFVKRFKGPNYGIEGIRKILKIKNRPLLAAALKPMGLMPLELSEWCFKFALGGIDIIKDDHGVCGQFEERVKLCQKAVDRAKEKTGKEILYFPNLTFPVEEIVKKIEYGLKIGVKGFMVSPFIIGLDYFRYLTENYPLIFVAHPALSGAFYTNERHGIDAELVLGLLFRLSGADIVIFPNFGGRFPFTKETCSDIDHNLKKDFFHLKRGFPCPAGGIEFDNIPSVRNFYGDDVVILIGASLYLKFRSSGSKVSGHSRENGNPVPSLLDSCLRRNDAIKNSFD